MLHTLVFLTTVSAFGASDPQADLENRQTDLDEKHDGRVNFKGGFEVQLHQYDNVDFRLLDETSDQAILDSDDRGSFAFTGVNASVGIAVDDKTHVTIAASHRGLWGNDQMGNTNVYGGWLYFTAANVRHTYSDKLSSTLGRQYFQPGALGGSREFIFADIIDGLRVDYAFTEKAKLTFLGDVVSGSINPSDITLVGYLGQSNVQSFNFRGDRRTKRFGGMFSVDDLSDAMAIRAYAFYTDIGALGSGSNISYNGRLGNFADNDWVANFGLRANYAMGSVLPFVSVDYSTGIDRKELIVGDVNTTGYALSGGLVINDPDVHDLSGFSAELSGFMAQGAAYKADGTLFSHGYVGMKARQMGGTLANRYLGMHPSAYVGMFGVSDNQNDKARKSGTAVIHANVQYGFTETLAARLSVWNMKDTGVSQVNFNTLDTLDPPYGYSRLEYAAQERLGKTLGQEINLDLMGTLTESTSVQLNAGVFLPGAFYQQTINRIAGNQLGGDQMAWTINATSQVSF